MNYFSGSRAQPHQTGISHESHPTIGRFLSRTCARIGDSEERIKTLYPNQVSISPSKYAAGAHYLTVVPASAADGAYRIIFETDGKRVVNYRAGLRPQVEYVEGCG